METNSLNYPNQVKLSERLAELYGASFGIGVSKKAINIGLIFLWTLSMIIIYRIVRFSPKRWTFEGNYFCPNIQAGQFEAETFQREKENLKAYLESIVEDKQTYASLALQSVYFNQSEDQKSLVSGPLRR